MPDQQKICFTHNQSLLHPPGAIAAIVSKLTTGAVRRHEKEERRAAERYTVVTIVEAQSLDDDYNLTGEPFKAVTRDLSTIGIGLTHNQSIESKYLAIQLTAPEGTQLQTVVEVTRSQPFGSMWEIGGRFVTDVDGVVESRVE